MIDHLEGIKTNIQEAIQQCFDHAIAVDEVILQHTKKEFEGTIPWWYFHLHEYLEISQKQSLLNLAII